MVFWCIRTQIYIYRYIVIIYRCKCICRYVYCQIGCFEGLLYCIICTVKLTPEKLVTSRFCDCCNSHAGIARCYASSIRSITFRHLHCVAKLVAVFKRRSLNSAWETKIWKWGGGRGGMEVNLNYGTKQNVGHFCWLYFGCSEAEVYIAVYIMSCCTFWNLWRFFLRKTTIQVSRIVLIATIPIVY